MNEAVSPPWSVRLVVPVEQTAFFEDILTPFCEVMTIFEAKDDCPDGDWVIEGVCQEQPDRGQVSSAIALGAAGAGFPEPEVVIAQLPDLDWLAENRRAFPPLIAGRFFVHGSHFEGRPPVGSLPILVDAATAFGSGRHPSTWGCLQAISDLSKARRFVTCLDVGCGSGILALAMAKRFRSSVTASDMDPESVRVTKDNAAKNGVAAYIRVHESLGFDKASVRAPGPYDLIAANILARPLRAMAVDLAQALAPGGKVVLAGLLRSQARTVANAYREQGLALERVIGVENWATLILTSREDRITSKA